MSEARRYIAVIQDARGYPSTAGTEPAPPEGPAPPMLHSVVRADDHERIVQGLTDALREIADPPGPYGGADDIEEARRIARAALSRERKDTVKPALTRWEAKQLDAMDAGERKDTNA